MPRKIGSLTLYSVDDLHELLGISKMTLRAYLREGKLKGRKMGVQWFVTEEAIRDYFNQEQEPAEAKSPATTTRPQLKYIVQGINDLASEKEECATKKMIRHYINQEQKAAEAKRPATKTRPKLKYIVQSINDLVNETEEWTTIKKTLDCLHSQAIISLFQVQVTDAHSDEIIEIVKARDFIDRHS